MKFLPKWVKIAIPIVTIIVTTATYIHKIANETTAIKELINRDDKY